MINDFRAVDSQAAARPSQVDYLCQGNEYPTLRDLHAHFRSQGLDYAIECAGAPVYACIAHIDGAHGVLLIGHIRVVVYYDLFADPGFEVLIVQSNGKEV